MVGKDGSSVVSDRLDIVRLIDAKVTSTRRTVTRSKQLAEAAKGDLHIHEDWLRQHNERFGHDLKRQQRRMKRRERIENNKRFAKSALLFLPRLCARLYRGVVLSSPRGRRYGHCWLRLARQDSLRLWPLADRASCPRRRLGRLASLEARTDPYRSALARFVLTWEGRPCIGARPRRRNPQRPVMAWPQGLEFRAGAVCLCLCRPVPTCHDHWWR